MPSSKNAIASKLQQAKAVADKSKPILSPVWEGPESSGSQGGVTYSLLCRWLSCKERARLLLVEGLRSTERWRPSTGYGNMWHVCEEALASCQEVVVPNGLGMNTYWEVCLKAHAIEQAKLFPFDGEAIEHWYNVCKVQFPEYIKYWSQHPDMLARTPLLQEQVFRVPYQLPSGRTVYLRGKWDSVDLVGSGKDAGIWLMENKTKSEVDAEQLQRQLTFDLQVMTYLVSLRAAADMHRKGADVGLPEDFPLSAPIIGVRYNVIWRSCTIRQHKARGKTPAEGKAEFYARLRDDYYASDPGRYFHRWNVRITQEDIDKFRRTCLDPMLETLCIWWELMTGKASRDHGTSHYHWRHPFGCANPLDNGYEAETDNYLNTGSKVGLETVSTLFRELEET